MRFTQKVVFGAFTFTTAVIAFQLGCNPATWFDPKPDPPQHLVLIVVDTLRGDYLGYSGGPANTPNIDAFAKSGVVFLNARSTAPSTGPSHSSLFTGLFPISHGVMNNAQLLDAEFVTIAEMATLGGFRAAAFVSLGVLKQEFGFGQGFDHYDQRFKSSWSRHASEINDSVSQWIENDWNGESLFLWVHYSDPHEPYAAPGRPFPVVGVFGNSDTTAAHQRIPVNGHAYTVEVEMTRGEGTLSIDPEPSAESPMSQIVVEILSPKNDSFRYSASEGALRAPQKAPIFYCTPPAEILVHGPSGLSDPKRLRFSVKRKLSEDEARIEYRHEVEYVDHEFGRLLAVLKDSEIYDDSLIIFTADHGEGLADHGLFGHIHQLYDSLLHVPLIMVSPGVIPESKTVDAAVSTIDVVPTVVDLYQLTEQLAWHGKSLMPLVMGGQKPDGSVLLASTAKPQAKNNLDALVANDFKLIRNRDTEVTELFDLRSDPQEQNNIADQNRELASRLKSRLITMLKDGESGDWVLLDEEEKRQLEALGYVDQK